ncbi:hypothetical protein [Nonomuraea guangzhouensis]|uniref:Uncharacterized protein n=1 Tax=Nonomuraea guangzhouensis TaxID=1291555 RepID=A0ABW4G1M4_9ACTN|nr:hypothetical protein [Nonomuraea guangzhouensis]
MLRRAERPEHPSWWSCPYRRSRALAAGNALPTPRRSLLGTCCGEPPTINVGKGELVARRR